MPPMRPAKLAESSEEGSTGTELDEPAGVDHRGLPLKVVVFVVGAASLGTEIAAARLLAPFFGSSTIVWANTIGVVLVALSAGYWWGGKLADKGPRYERLSRLILAGGAALAVVPLVGHPFLTLTIGPLESLSVGAFFGSLLGVLVLVAGPVLLLGAVAPFAIRLSVARVEEAGQTSGRLYAISTAGSLLGTFLAALLLIPFVGTHRTFLIFALSVTIVGALGLARRWWVVPLIVAVLIALPPGGIKTEAAHGNVIYETETPYQYIRVIQEKSGGRALQIDDALAIHSYYQPGEWLTEDYWDEPLVLPITVTGRPPATLAILGNAAGTTAREYGHFFPNTRVWGVDIDPKMAEIGRRFFDLHGPHLNLVSQDARPFLRKNGRFEAIFLDAYREPEIPWYLTTREFFELARKHLAPGGSLIANVAHSVGSDAIERTITRTMHAVFPYITRDPLTETNSLLVASNVPASAARLKSYVPRLPEELQEVGKKTAQRLTTPLGGGSVYTDDRDAIEWLIDRDIIQHDLGGG
jgi:spermidine synthase